MAALSGARDISALVEFAQPGSSGAVFRSALCFWQDEDTAGGIAHEAGPWAIAEYLEFPQGSRFLQSFKSVAASSSFEHATIFEKRLKFEELGQMFLARLRHHGGSALAALPQRIIVGRPVRYVGARPDVKLARQRYDAMFAALGREIHYVFEPLGAAFSFASRLSEPATLLVADFGGGTSDFSVVRIEAPDARQRCVALSSEGIGIAGDRFDYRIMDRLLLPLLGKGSTYRSFDKILEIPAGHFADFGDWSRQALMRNRRTLESLARLQHSATDKQAIGRMIAVVQDELGYPLYEAVGALKRKLSEEQSAHFHFSSDALKIEADVTRSQFESWIAGDLERIAGTVDLALAKAHVTPEDVDHVFLTGGSSLIPAVRRIFEQRFAEHKIASGSELTSIAHGLALIGQESNITEWTVPDDQ